MINKYAIYAFVHPKVAYGPIRLLEKKFLKLHLHPIAENHVILIKMQQVTIENIYSKEFTMTIVIERFIKFNKELYKIYDLEMLEILIVLLLKF